MKEEFLFKLSSLLKEYDAKILYYGFITIDMNGEEIFNSESWCIDTDTIENKLNNE